MKIEYEFSELTVNPSKANITALNTISLYGMLVTDYVEKLESGEEMSDIERDLHKRQVQTLVEISDAIFAALKELGVYDNV